MMKKMAHIVDGKVVNVSNWDGQSEWNPIEEVVEIPVVEIIDEVTGESLQYPAAGIGWDYVDGVFVDNRPVEEFLDV